MTTETGKTAAPTAPNYEKHLRFTASPEAVYDALTSVDAIATWWDAWDPITGSATEGGEMRFYFDSDKNEQLVLRVDRAQRPSVVRWSVPSCPVIPDWVGTTPVFTLGPSGDGGCELHFVHEGLTPRLECYDMCRKGWNEYIPQLHAYVESRHGRAQ